MDHTAPIVPMFNGQLGHGAAALCDFFLINDETLVQVIKLTLMVDGKKHKFLVAEGKYKMTLFLLYCAVLKQSASFKFDDDLRAMLVPYFGTATVDNARLEETRHATLQLFVLGTDIEVNLVLRPDYKLPKGPGRAVRKLIEHGWKQLAHKGVNPDTPLPLVRQAIEAFRKGQHDGTIGIVYSWSPQIWPSDKWVDRIWSLAQNLGMHKNI